MPLNADVKYLKKREETRRILMVDIRREKQRDYATVRVLNDTAFGQTTEGVIVDNIRGVCNEILSLVAVKEGEVVGHILFSPISVNCEGKRILGMGLAPMAVLPQYQNQGIGTQLVNEGIKILKASKIPFIVVLGHAKYYPRFGFQVASKYGLVPQWEGVPDDVFMVLFLDESMKNNVHGVVNYRKEFNEA